MELQKNAFLSIRINREVTKQIRIKSAQRDVTPGVVGRALFDAWLRNDPRAVQIVEEAKVPKK